MAGRGRDERYIVQHIPLVILDPSSSSSDSDEYVPQTPPPDPGSPVPAPPVSPPPPTPPPPQSPPVSHSDSSDQHLVMRTPVRVPTVTDDSDYDRPAAPVPRGRPRTRATARKSTGYRPSRPLAPRDLFPHSTHEVGESSHQPDYSSQIEELASDVEGIRSTVHETRWMVQGTHYDQQELAGQVKELVKSGKEWKEKVEDQVHGYSETVTQHHVQTLSQIDRLQRMLIVAAGVAFVAVLMMVLPQFLG